MQFLIAHGHIQMQVVGSQQPGCHEGSPPCMTASRAGFLVLLWGTGLSQHSSPHTGLHVCKADGPYNRGWVFVWMLFSLEVCGSEHRCGPNGAFAASIQSSRKCLFFRMYNFCKWLITVNPGCDSRAPISVTITKKKLYTKTSGSGSASARSCSLVCPAEIYFCCNAD